jgi:Tfp pilus assembly protein PilF
MGIAYERTGQAALAGTAYARAFELSREVYPAALGTARIMQAEGRRAEAISFLRGLQELFPDNISVKRALAFAYYNNQSWVLAESAVQELLDLGADAELLLALAHIFVETGQFVRAVSPLDLYSASFDPNNRFYLFLRARIQAEGNHNREAALAYLRIIPQLPLVDDATAVYAADMLLASNREADREAGRGLLESLLALDPPSLLATDLAFRDAIHREAWNEAAAYLARLLEEKPLPQHLLNAYKVERGLGNRNAALYHARAFHRLEPLSEEGRIAYISALIDVGQREEASRLIETRLANLNGGSVKSQYLFLRSSISLDEESALRDLRLSLFEDPRNLNALIALFDIHRTRGDRRRASHYYRQAISFFPDNPYLLRFAGEYR